MASWIIFHVFINACLFVQASGTYSSHIHTLGVSTLHMSYICPEGANVTLVCRQSGALAHPIDVLQRAWFFTPHMDQHCQHQLRRHSHGNSTAAVVHKAQGSSFSITLLEVTSTDQGRYCCQIADVLVRNKNEHTVLQYAHSSMLLTVSPRHNNSENCIFMDHNTSQFPIQESSVAAGLATIACIMGLLCLPLILVLVYRQKQGAHRSRRAHELVRMDSEAQGHDNPVFMGGSPQPLARTVSAILTRQSSESGRHLLSDPGTPFSPNTQGEVFFPAQEPIPESHEFLAA